MTDQTRGQFMKFWPVVATAIVLLAYGVAGVSSYSTMAAKMEQLEEFRVEAKADLKEVAKDVSEIKSDIKVLLSRQTRKAGE
jgi:hypothetical protein